MYRKTAFTMPPRASNAPLRRMNSGGMGSNMPARPSGASGESADDSIARRPPPRRGAPTVGSTWRPDLRVLRLLRGRMHVARFSHPPEPPPAVEAHKREVAVPREDANRLAR